MGLPGEPVTEVATEEEPLETDTVAGDSRIETDDAATEPVVEGAAEVDETTPPPDPFEQLGGQDAVQQAVDFHQHIQTEEGALEAFFMLGRAFGFGINELEAMFKASAGDTSTKEPEPADDEPLTYAQVKQLLEQQNKPIAERLARQEQERVELAARSTIDSEFQQLGLADTAADKKTKAAILQMGDAYLGDDLSPENVRRAVRKGHADFVALVQDNAEKYRKQKADQKAKTPKAITGSGAPADQPLPEPKNLEEAFARARKRLGME